MPIAARQPDSRAPWVAVRLTRAGWAFFVICLIVGLAASKGQVSLVFILFGMMLGALGTSALLAWRMVAAVRVSRDLPQRAWQNSPVHVGYHLRNIRRHGACLAVRVGEVDARGIQSAAAYCLHLPARSVFRASGRFVARRRGVIRLSALTVSTIFPFGLVEAVRKFNEPVELLIWPARGRLKRKLLYQGAVETSSAAPSRATGGQDEFFGLREYRPGDNPRWIHWRRSAAAPAPVVREMAHPLPETLWVILDTQAPPTPAGTAWRERLLRFAATLIDHALARGYRVGLAIACDRTVRVIRPSEGRGQRSDLLDALAEADANVHTSLAVTLGELPRGLLAKAEAVVAGPPDALAAAPLAAVRARCRHLQVITTRDLPPLFEDDPLAAAEDADAV